MSITMDTVVCRNSAVTFSDPRVGVYIYRPLSGLVSSSASPVLIIGSQNSEIDSLNLWHPRVADSQGGEKQVICRQHISSIG